MYIICAYVSKRQILQETIEITTKNKENKKDPFRLYNTTNNLKKHASKWANNEALVEQGKC